MNKLHLSLKQLCLSVLLLTSVAPVLAAPKLDEATLAKAKESAKMIQSILEIPEVTQTISVGIAKLIQVANGYMENGNQEKFLQLLGEDMQDKYESAEAFAELRETYSPKKGGAVSGFAVNPKGLSMQTDGKMQRARLDSKVAIAWKTEEEGAVVFVLDVSLTFDVALDATPEQVLEGMEEAVVLIEGWKEEKVADEDESEKTPEAKPQEVQPKSKDAVSPEKSHENKVPTPKKAASPRSARSFA